MASTADTRNHAAGKIEVSRAFGDAALKSRGLSAVADVQTFNLTKQDRFLILGCDGFWSCWSADEAVKTTQGLLEGGRSPKEAANRIIYLVSLINTHVGTACQHPQGPCTATISRLCSVKLGHWCSSGSPLQRCSMAISCICTTVIKPGSVARAVHQGAAMQGQLLCADHDV